MHLEVLGFLFGVLVVGVAGLMFLRHETLRVVRSVYGRDIGRKASHGNALIWPSH